MVIGVFSVFLGFAMPVIGFFVMECDQKSQTQGENQDCTGKLLLVLFLLPIQTPIKFLDWTLFDTFPWVFGANGSCGDKLTVFHWIRIGVINPFVCHS